MIHLTLVIFHFSCHGWVKWSDFRSPSRSLLNLSRIPALSHLVVLVGPVRSCKDVWISPWLWPFLSLTRTYAMPSRCTAGRQNPSPEHVFGTHKFYTNLLLRNEAKRETRSSVWCHSFWKPEAMEPLVKTKFSGEAGEWIHMWKAKIQQINQRNRWK